MTMYRSIVRLLFLLAIASQAYAAERQLPGRVLRVIDGDSLVLDLRGSQYHIELADIDAPELNQPWGQAAAQHLRLSLTGGFVIVHWSGAADDGRIRGRLIYKDRDTGLEMLRRGLAWCTVGPLTVAPEQNRPYRDAESVARERRQGLWADEKPIPPWEWRERRPQAFDQSN